MITPYRSADKIAEPKRPIVIPWPTFDVDSMGSQDQGAFAAHFLVWLFVNVVGLIAGFVDYVAPGRAPPPGGRRASGRPRGTTLAAATPRCRPPAREASRSPPFHPPPRHARLAPPLVAAGPAVTGP